LDAGRHVEPTCYCSTSTTHHTTTSHSLPSSTPSNTWSQKPATPSPAPAAVSAATFVIGVTWPSYPDAATFCTRLAWLCCGDYCGLRSDGRADALRGRMWRLTSIGGVQCVLFLFGEAVQREILGDSRIIVCDVCMYLTCYRKAAQRGRGKAPFFFSEKRLKLLFKRKCSFSFNGDGGTNL
jgi:hypothetical protein